MHQPYTIDKMIVTKLIGGLGNQMFQVAAGLAVAKRNSTPLQVDISALKKYPKHNGYQFPQIFKTSPKLASNWELLCLLKSDYRRVLFGSTMGPVNLSHNKQKIVRYQLQHDFSQDFEALGKPCYLSGYWQSEKFFAGCEGDIREVFTFREPMDDANNAIISKISSCSAVSLHVRRGDYIGEAKVNAFHGVCPWDYYERAMDYILARVPHARFFAFSDDPEWVSDKARGTYRLEVVDINHGPKSYLDMYLMTRCQHHIIANSTFSWWGAYLGTNEQKIVVAPKVWFDGDPWGIKDIYCSGWRVM